MDALIIIVLLAIVAVGVARALAWIWMMSGKITKPFGDAASNFVEFIGRCIGSFFKGLKNEPVQLEFSDFPQSKQERLERLKAWRAENRLLLEDLDEHEKKAALKELEYRFSKKVKELFDE